MSHASKALTMSLLVLIGVAGATALADQAAPAGETPTTTSTHRTPGQVLDDSAITAKVKTQLIADPTTKARHIDVTTRERVVSLTGHVDSADERVRAVQIARNTKGVHSVDDELTIGEATTESKK